MSATSPAVDRTAARAPARVPAPRRAAPQRTRPRATPAPAAGRRRRAAERAGVLGGVAWIVALAVLLGGVVFLNVAALQLTVQLDRLSRERADLKAANATLRAELSSGASRVDVLARQRLGLVPAERTSYVRLPAR